MRITVVKWAIFFFHNLEGVFMSVFVLSHDSKPLNPCSERKARLLIKSNQAKFISRKPNTIQLSESFEIKNLKLNKYSVGVDTGTKHIGIAITIGKTVVNKYEIILRDDVKELLEARASLRRGRRARNTRYREARFLNRKTNKVKNWLAPSIQNRVNHTIRFIDRFCNLLPTYNLNIEVGQFDVAKIINPHIKNSEYQKGVQYGFENVKTYVRTRDKFTCQQCLNDVIDFNGKNKTKKAYPKPMGQLEVHHIKFRSQGGSDRPSNLVTLCKEHHKAVHNGSITLNFISKDKTFKNGKEFLSFKEPPIMNSIKCRLKEHYPNARYSKGYQTKVQREALNQKSKQITIDKTHANDAVCISGIQEINFDMQVVKIVQKTVKSRQLHLMNPWNSLSKKTEPPTPRVRLRAKNSLLSRKGCNNFKATHVDKKTGLVMEVRKNDEVKYKGQRCLVTQIVNQKITNKIGKITSYISIGLSDLNKTTLIKPLYDGGKSRVIVTPSKIKPIQRNNNFIFI